VFLDLLRASGTRTSASAATTATRAPAPGAPRIDWLGGLVTGCGNRPYMGHTAVVRVLYRFQHRDTGTDLALPWLGREDMKTPSLTAEDVHLWESIVQELDRASEVEHSVIDVTVNDGVVTLTGVIDSYAGKLAAERVAKGVRGMWAVSNDLTVQVKVDRTDADVAADTTQAVKLRPVFQRVFR